MKVSNHSSVPVYTVSGAQSRPLPDWLIRQRKRSLKQDPEFANRVEILQNFEFEEASQCVRVSPDGDYVMSTGTYKPQIHVHYTPHLSLSFARHTKALNTTFQILSDDYSKSIHLQTDRWLEFHTAGGLHYTTRIPRYGRDLIYDRHSAEALVPTVGVNSDQNGEVFRLNLEVGRFMKAYEVDVGGDDHTTVGAGALQGGINTGSVECGAIAEDSHNLLAFGTSLGTVEFWDPRSKSRVGILSAPNDASSFGSSERAGVTALQFHQSGLEIATGNSEGLIHLYDLRSPVPLLKKDQGFGFPINNIIYLNSGTSARAQTSEPKILTADKRIIKIWDRRDGKAWTSVEPAVDLNHVEWVKDSGMLLTANEGKQQHSFFIPQLGPAPKWCAFLDNLVEEMAEDSNDPNAFRSTAAGEIYDNYKFLTLPQLKQLNLDHLVGTTALVKPYMHGYFINQKLYEEARLISNPEIWQEQRQKSIQEKINKERESRIRGNKKVTVKVNRKLAEKLLERQEKAERRRARKVIEQGGDEDMVDADKAPAVQEEVKENPASGPGILNDPRFAKLFQDEDFEVDEESREFQAINPIPRLPKGLTAVEQEEMEPGRESSSEESSSESETEAPRAKKENKFNKTDANKISSVDYRRQKQKPQPKMVVSNSNVDPRKMNQARNQSFGARVADLKERKVENTAGNTIAVGEREISFMPAKKEKKKRMVEDEAEVKGQRHDRKDRRSASGNVFRRM